MSAGSRGEDDDRDADGPDEEERMIDEAEEDGDQSGATTTGASGDDGAAESGPDVAKSVDVEALRARLDTLQAELESFEDDVDDRTVHRSEIESELRGYVRARLRRGHARGWGPYLVLLYGTAMTLGAFYLLTGGWAILAMVVVWLSTLGLYALMLIVGAVFGIASLPGRVLRKVR